MTSPQPSRPSPPSADLRVDIATVRRHCTQLVAESGLDLGTVKWNLGERPSGEGWDNVLWPVGHLDGRPLVLRTARRDSARALLRREVAVLRRLAAAAGADDLPLEIPVPLATAEDAVLLRWVPGPTAADVDAAARRHTAHALARMLAAVHVTPPPDMERNPVRGVPLATRSEFFARDLARAEVTDDQRAGAEKRWEGGLAAPRWRGTDLLLHGDPHPGNVIVPPPAARRAVLIDWGDTTAGDPASDLGGLLLHHPAGTVLETYRDHAGWIGRQDEAWQSLVGRAWAWGTRMALSLITAYGRDQPLGRAGHRFLAT